MCSGPDQRFSSRAVDLASAFRGQPRAADSTPKPPLGWGLELIVFYSELFPGWHYWLMALFPTWCACAWRYLSVALPLWDDRNARWRLWFCWTGCGGRSVQEKKEAPLRHCVSVQQKFIYIRGYDSSIFRRENCASFLQELIWDHLSCLNFNYD